MLFDSNSGRASNLRIKAEAGGSWIPGQPRPHNKIPSQKQNKKWGFEIHGMSQDLFIRLLNY